MLQSHIVADEGACEYVQIEKKKRDNSGAKRQNVEGAKKEEGKVNDRGQVQCKFCEEGWRIRPLDESRKLIRGISHGLALGSCVEAVCST